VVKIIVETSTDLRQMKMLIAATTHMGQELVLEMTGTIVQVLTSVVKMRVTVTETVTAELGSSVAKITAEIFMDIRQA